MLADDNENEKLELSDAGYTLQKIDSEISTTPLTLKYWEMQRTDSGQSIIKVTTDSTPLQITRTNQIDQFSTAENGNTTDDNNSVNDGLNSDDSQIEFTTPK